MQKELINLAKKTVVQSMRLVKMLMLLKMI